MVSGVATVVAESVSDTATYSVAKPIALGKLTMFALLRDLKLSRKIIRGLIHGALPDMRV